MSIIAIDFGTSNTAIAILTSQDDWDIDKPKTLCFDDISRDFVTSEGIASLVPSLVYVSGKQQFLFGKQVEKKAGSQVKEQDHSKRLFQSFKRDIVANFRSPDREIDGERYDVEAIAEIFLMEIWQRLRSQNIEPTQLILTVPVGAFEAYLNWFHSFADKIQGPSLKIIDESTA
ncbi:MAG: Hsp70 family protein, partial [Pseudanabaena sp.]